MFLPVKARHASLEQSPTGCSMCCANIGCTPPCLCSLCNPPARPNSSASSTCFSFSSSSHSSWSCLLPFLPLLPKFLSCLYFHQLAHTISNTTYILFFIGLLSHLASSSGCFLLGDCHLFHGGSRRSIHLPVSTYL